MKTAVWGILALGFAVQADATAIASVKEAFWQADFAYYYDPLTDTQISTLPSGVTLACTGSAQAHGLSGCMDKRGAFAASSHGKLVSHIVNAFGGFTLHNSGATPYDGTFVFTTKYSAFNPGGPDIGAMVDNPAVEFADFFTVVSGPGAFDLHGCSMQHGAGPHGGSSLHSCGVTAPGFNFGQAILGPLEAGGATVADYRIHIRVDAKGDDPSNIPEPATAALFATGLFLLRPLRRRLGRAKPETSSV